ncbi:MAG: Fic family protein [Clostridiales bacterium]|nr:Fic family protein [Clostridiales bacterium]
MAFDPYSVKDFLKAHKLMTEGLIDESGRFRSGDVGVFDGDIVVHVGARPQLIEELFGWAKESELHPVLKSAVVHCEIETVHPFADGNGRMGRLWQTLVLAKWNEIFEWLPMESVVYAKRPQYYEALQNAQKINDSTGFIEFTLSALLDTLKTQAEQSKGDGIKDGIKDGINESQKKMLMLVNGNPYITADTLAAELGINKRNAEKNIKVLKDAGLLVRVGARKNGYWKVARS